MRPRTALIAVILFIALACAACAGKRMDLNLPVRDAAHNVSVSIRYEDGLEWDARFAAEILPEALGAARSWGELQAPLTLRIWADHAQLEQHVGLHDAPWLRAWASYDTVQLQAPSSWGGVGVRARVANMLTHELTHLIMYQQAGSADDWYDKPLPLWFREGMALVTAGLGENHYPRERLREWYLSTAFPGDPLIEGERLLKICPREVYAASFYAFSDLEAQVGRDTLASMLPLIRQGYGFQESFHSATGLIFKDWLEAWHAAFLQPPP